MNAKNCSPARLTLQITGLTAENRSRTPLISKVCQTGKQYSAVYPVICIVCQTGKQFSALTSVIAKVFQTGKRLSAVIPIICRKLLTCLEKYIKTGMNAKNCSPARLTLQITGLTAENRLFA
jgi:hypothetical protein